MRVRRRGFCAFLALFGLALGGCGDGDAARALAAAEPYVDRFDRFDAWARRTVAADPAIRGRSRLQETLFAPVFLERDVADAWVVRARTEAGAWSFRGGALPGADAAWVRVRHPVHGPLGVLVAPMRTARGGSDEAPCLLLSRSGPGAAASEVRVVVAFVIAAADAT
jgi:hypothetical protein